MKRPRFRTPRSRILLVIGTGRSGTHLLTRCLIEHDGIEDLNDGREEPQRLSLSTDLAIGSSTSPRRDLNRLVHTLRDAARRCPASVFVDQSHPNLWHIEHLANRLAPVRFVAIQRQPLPVVSSMMLHPGVRRWCEDWRRYSHPNRFLGTTPQNLASYERASVAGKCAYRWVSHTLRIRHIATRADVDLVNYEELVESPAEALRPVLTGSGVPTAPGIDYPTAGGRNEKWRNTLSADEVSEVLSVCEQSGLMSAEERDEAITFARHRTHSSGTEADPDGRTEG